MLSKPRSEASEPSPSAPRASAARGVDDVDHAGEDRVGRVDAIDHDQATGALVEGDERRGLLLVQVEAVGDRLGSVVVALHDVATAHVADPRQLLGAGGDVVGPAVAAHPTGADPAEHEIAGHIEVDHDVDRALLGDLVEALGLADGAREAVEDVPPATSVVVRQPLANETDDDVVTDQATFVHY